MVTAFIEMVYIFSGYWHRKYIETYFKYGKSGGHCTLYYTDPYTFFKKTILFICFWRGEGRERNINVWLPLE